MLWNPHPFFLYSVTISLAFSSCCYLIKFWCSFAMWCGFCINSISKTDVWKRVCCFSVSCFFFGEHYNWLSLRLLFWLFFGLEASKTQINSDNNLTWYAMRHLFMFMLLATNVWTTQNIRKNMLTVRWTTSAAPLTCFTFIMAVYKLNAFLAFVLCW